MKKITSGCARVNCLYGDEVMGLACNAGKQDIIMPTSRQRTDVYMFAMQPSIFQPSITTQLVTYLNDQSVPIHGMQQIFSCVQQVYVHFEMHNPSRVSFYSHTYIHYFASKRCNVEVHIYSTARDMNKKE